MKIPLSLFRHLETLLEVMKAPPPQVVVKESSPGKKKFVILIEVNKIQCPIKSGNPSLQHTFFGYDPHSSSIAEHKAIMDAKKFLEDTFALQIHDFSYSKKIEYEAKIGLVLPSTKAFATRVESFLMEYESSVKKLVQLLSSIPENDSTVLTEVYKYLSDLINSLQPSTDENRKQFFCLDREISLLRCNNVATTSHNLLKPQPLVCKVLEKDFLSDLLQFFALPSAKYSTEVDENDLFTGTCKLYLGSMFGSNNIGPTKVLGEPKPTPVEAESSAAGHAVCYLERLKGIEIGDFNYDDFVAMRQKHDKIVQIRLKYYVLLSHVNQEWSVFVESVESFISHLHSTSRRGAFFSEDAELNATRARCASDIDEVLSSIKEKHHSALSVIAASFN